MSVQSFLKIILPLLTLVLSPNSAYAEPDLCIKVKERSTACPHYIIRSIQTDNPKYKNKAICICLSDFEGAADKQLENKLEQVQQVYQISREDLMELLTGSGV